MSPRQQVLEVLDRHCRRVEQDKFFSDVEKNPVRWGPLTPTIAKELKWSGKRVLYHLNAEAASGRVDRHMPYHSTVRWWVGRLKWDPTPELFLEAVFNEKTSYLLTTVDCGVTWRASVLQKKDSSGQRDVIHGNTLSPKEGESKADAARRCETHSYSIE